MVGPIVVPTTTTATGVTRAAYRAAIAGEIGHWRRLTISATPDAAVTPDAARQVLCTALRSDNVPATRYDGHWLYVPSTDETRRVLEGSYDGADMSLLLDDPFSTPLASGTAVEITNTLPGSWYADLKGLNQIVGDTLKILPVWARVAIEGNGTRSYSLNAYAEVADETISHLEDRYYGTTADPVEPSAYGFVVQQDGADRTLVTDAAYVDGAGFTLVAVRRAHRWIKSGGTWAEGDGLQSDADEAAAPEHWVRIFGAVVAYRYLIEVTEEDEALSEEKRARRIARYERRIRAYAPAQRRIRDHELPRLSPRRRRPAQAVLYHEYPTTGASLGMP